MANGSETQDYGSQAKADYERRQKADNQTRWGTSDRAADG
jgi:hypothetical protein